MQTTRTVYNAIAALTTLIADSRRLLVLTGAGCSTESGIPDYRDADGHWKQRRPIQYRAFVSDAYARQRYWARSLSGWQRVADARPGAAHTALARLEAHGLVHGLITQNVDGLHQKAGSHKVIDLHGRLDGVHCLSCRRRQPRAHLQAQLRRLNPDWPILTGQLAPDGDVELGGAEYASFKVPDCPACGGTLKPDVVFFGENVPRARVSQAWACLGEADAVLVVGSSLMVMSGYRFVRAASERGIPVAAVNLGRTRADDELTLRLPGACGDILTRLAERLAPRCF